MSSTLAVYWGTDLVGDLDQRENQGLTFRYAADWLGSPHRAPISLSLPLRAEPYGNDAAAFFSNLLPEGGVRAAIAQRLGISAGNDFKLLEALGGDCAGALSLLLPGTQPGQDGSYEPLPLDHLMRMIKQMPGRPLLSPEEGLRLSLAGAQNKLPIYMKSGAFFLAKGSFPSSHILKPPIETVDHSIENEVFCMTLAAHLGLPTAKAEVWPAAIPLFLTERYDRAESETGGLSRLHQEDFCQAMGYRAEYKYEADGGPTMRACFDLIDRHSVSPALDKRKLIRWVVFNCLIGNNDAHAKNVSLLFEQGGVRLAPFYDLLSTAIYPEIHQKLAMKVGGENRAAFIMRRHWERFAADASVAPRAVFSVCEEFIDKWDKAFLSAREKLARSPGDFTVLSSIEAHAKKMVEHMKVSLSEK